MEFAIEKFAMLIMKSGKRHMMEGLELPNQEKLERSEKRKRKNTWEYWTLTPSNKWTWKKKISKSISGEQNSYSKPKYIARTLQTENTRAVPLLRYSGLFLKWTREELKQMDRRGRKLITRNQKWEEIQLCRRFKRLTSNISRVKMWI